MQMAFILDRRAMKQTKRIIATGATVFLAVASAASLAEARPGFGGHGFGGFGGHGFGGFGHGFGGHAFSARSFGGFAHHNFAGHAFAHHAYGGHSLRAYRAAAGHAHHLANHAQHFAHAGTYHQLANQHQLAAHNQLANQHLQNGLAHNGLAQNGLVHNNLVHNAMGGRQQIAHNQFWGRQFGAHQFRHRHGFFFAGPVFWPFAFGDIFSFALWPYYDPFWDYGPDWLYASVFWPYDEDDYAYYAPYYSYGDIYTGSRHAARTYVESSAEETETCAGVAPGLVGLPMNRLERTLQPAPDQQTVFDDLKTASAKATEIMKASCPTEIPVTPISRLDAVERRVDAMREAVQVLLGPLDAFYASLTDEQKQRLQSLAENHGRNHEGANLAEMCSQSARHFTELPSGQIQKTVRPNDKQSSELDALKDASNKAADILNGTCPTQTPSTPGARLDAIAKRLDAMAQAVKTMRPALQGFYASLDDEQKARFNTMNEQAQRQG